MDLYPHDSAPEQVTPTQDSWDDVPWDDIPPENEFESAPVEPDSATGPFPPGALDREFNRPWVRRALWIGLPLLVVGSSLILYFDGPIENVESEYWLAWQVVQGALFLALTLCALWRAYEKRAARGVSILYLGIGCFCCLHSIHVASLLHVRSVAQEGGWLSNAEHANLGLRPGMTVQEVREVVTAKGLQWDDRGDASRQLQSWIPWGPTIEDRYWFLFDAQGALCQVTRYRWSEPRSWAGTSHVSTVARDGHWVVD